MNNIPSYTKILTLGSSGSEDALTGEVIIQEKVDGSQFGFGVNEKGELVARSKSVPMFKENFAEMFNEGMNYIFSIEDKITKSFKPETYFYCEYLQKPKHNTLKYNQTPKNHLVIFDALIGGAWASRKQLERIAKLLDIDVVPEIYRGVAVPEDIKNMLDRESYLGGEKIEGVVIKNYGQMLMLGGHVFPLFTKFVSEKFKEKHEVDWKARSPKTSLLEFIKGFKTEARWRKSIIHLEEQGKLTNSPKDIGQLIQMIQDDIVAEEEKNIKDFLYKQFITDILRSSINGFPQWYKEKLLNNLNTPAHEDNKTTI